MLNYLDTLFPIRYTAMGLCVLGLLLSLFSLVAFGAGALVFLLCAVLVGVGVYDLRQSKRSILRNYPIIGHIRFMLEFVRPEIRQYFIENDNEATPFSRAQRVRYRATLQRQHLQHISHELWCPECQRDSGP